MNTYICVYLGAAVLGLLLTPMVIRLGRVLKVLDQPGFRKVHTTAVPRLGGLVIAAATLAMILCVLALDNVIGQTFQKSKAQVLAMLQKDEPTREYA
ncbi:MAG: hypothetical protein SVT52_01335 [Planctomycetota bacterium]|nr:hypothetical protein [Planctomycetota bacterium]